MFIKLGNQKRGGGRRRSLLFLLVSFFAGGGGRTTGRRDEKILQLHLTPVAKVTNFALCVKIDSVLVSMPGNVSSCCTWLTCFLCSTADLATILSFLASGMWANWELVHGVWVKSCNYGLHYRAVKDEQDGRTFTWQTYIHRTSAYKQNKRNIHI